MIAELIVNECSSIPSHVETNQYMHCDVISRALRHARTYPAATQKGVVDLCLYQLQSMCKCMCMHTGIKIFLPCSYVANMYNKATRARSKHDDQDIGIRQIFTRQNFPDLDWSKFSTIKILRHTVT